MTQEQRKTKAIELLHKLDISKKKEKKNEGKQRESNIY